MNYANLIKLFLVSMTISSVAVASPQMIWQDKSNYIAISNQSGAVNNHPYEITPEKLARILSQLRITNNAADGVLSLIESKSATNNRVFSNKEIDILAQGLSTALTKATQNEAVTFSVSDLKNVYLGNKSLSISGTSFIQNKHLNIIFGEIHVDIHKKYVRSGQGVSNSRFASNVELANFKLNTGSLTKAGQHDWRLYPFSGSELVNQRLDWIRISLDRDYEYSQEPAYKEDLQQKYLSEEQKKQNDHQQNELEERIKKLEQGATLQTTTHTLGSSVETRLRQLKALYEQGTIPEAIYLEKMRSIMSEL